MGEHFQLFPIPLDEELTSPEFYWKQMSQCFKPFTSWVTGFNDGLMVLAANES